MKNINELAKLICQKYYHGNIQFLPTIRKTILHDAILKGIVESGMGTKLYFQGGTSLRRVYGLPRLSEDLDFVSGKKLQSGLFKQLVTSFENILRNELVTKFGISENNIIVNPPKPIIESDSLSIERWIVQVATESRISKDKINIEIVNVPSHENSPKPLLPVFPEVGAANIMLRTESLEEIFADKILAVAFRPFRKYRDYFDLGWLKAVRSSQGQYSFDTSLIFQKVQDYNEDPETFLERLEIAGKYTDLDKTGFMQEISRFVIFENEEQQHEYYDAFFKPGIEIINAIREASEKSLGQEPDCAPLP